MMAHTLLIGIGAGAASGLLFASMASGSLLGVILLYLTPLPLLIAGLGWGYLAAAAGAIAATAVTAVLLQAGTALYLLISLGFPSVWLARLALLSRQNESGESEFYPIGRIVVWIGLMGAGIISIYILFMSMTDIPYREAFTKLISQFITAMNETAINETSKSQPLTTDQIKAIAAQMASTVPPVSALIWMLVMLANLWLAGRILVKADRLQRPWPNIPSLDFPAQFHFVLPVAMVLAFMPGLIGELALPVTAVCLLAYALMGLAILHQITLNQPSRPFILTGIYFGIILLAWPLVILAVIAIGEPVFKLRARMAHQNTPPDSGK